MTDIKKFYLVSEHDYTLLKKAKGEQIASAPSSLDIDVKNNLDLNKKLLAATSSKRVAENGDDEAGSTSEDGQAKMDDSILEDQLKNESMESSFSEDPEAVSPTTKERFLGDLRRYLPPKVADKGEMLALRIFAIPGTVFNGKEQTVTLDKSSFALSQLMEFIMFCMSRKKPPNDTYLSEIAVFLSKHGVASSIITNPYMKTRMIIADSPTKLGAFAMVPKPENRSPKPYKWYSSLLEAVGDEGDDDL